MYASEGLQNKIGFTLIELLAVIVILAIIALIATPIVLNIINESKEKAQITGNTSWDSTSEDSLPYSVKTYAWLYDRTSIFCSTYGCLNNSDIETFGYWTATADATFNSYIWYINYYGSIVSEYDGDSLYGVRPVIEVLKSKL